VDQIAILIISTLNYRATFPNQRLQKKWKHCSSDGTFTRVV